MYLVCKSTCFALFKNVHFRYNYKSVNSVVAILVGGFNHSVCNVFNIPSLSNCILFSFKCQHKTTFNLTTQFIVTQLVWSAISTRWQPKITSDVCRYERTSPTTAFLPRCLQFFHVRSMVSWNVLLVHFWGEFRRVVYRVFALFCSQCDDMVCGVFCATRYAIENLFTATDTALECLCWLLLRVLFCYYRFVSIWLFFFWVGILKKVFFRYAMKLYEIALAMFY